MSVVSGIEGEGVTTVPQEMVEEELSQESSDLYYCRTCGALITSGSERVEVDGGHVHTFVNPTGYIYRIACFRTAPGCVVVGEPTNEFTWFAGSAWAVAVCTSCTAHLGWAYFREVRREFFGLILDQLRHAGE